MARIQETFCLTQIKASLNISNGNFIKATAAQIAFLKYPRVCMYFCHLKEKFPRIKVEHCFSLSWTFPWQGNASFRKVSHLSLVVHEMKIVIEYESQTPFIEIYFVIFNATMAHPYQCTATKLRQEKCIY